MTSDSEMDEGSRASVELLDGVSDAEETRLASEDDVVVVVVVVVEAAAAAALAEVAWKEECTAKEETFTAPMW